MKIKINAEILCEEVVQEYIIPQLEANNIKFDANCFKILVHSEKQDKDVEVKVDNIKFIYNKE